VPYVLAQRSNPRLIVGGAGIDFYDAKPPQIGYWIACAHRRKGFAGEVARALVRQIFSLSEAESVAAYCWASNIASQRVLKSAGMRLVGRGQRKSAQRGRYMPSLFMRVERKSWEKAQTRPSHERFGAKAA
jgi:RimJ/RimL family protein N-acetyltransferase